MRNQSTEYESKKQNLRLLGMVLFVVGGGLLIIGVASIFSAMTAPTDWDNFSASSSQRMGNFIIGAILLSVGSACAGAGYKLYFVTHIRGLARYTAVETAPAAEIMTEAIGSGLSRGFVKEGDSPFSQGKEVIRIKCRNCGYLETEDADFCSKCGEKV